uniref:Uncharacterized protein n=1 Tax=Monodon monoceros TaxID=40151 RepID=A0A8C6CAP8_MONMO
MQHCKSAEVDKLELMFQKADSDLDYIQYSCICATFNKTMTLIQELQKQTDLKLLPLTEEEKTAAEQLRAHMSDL